MVNSANFVTTAKEISDILGEDYVNVLNKNGITVTKIDTAPQYGKKGDCDVYMKVDTPSFGEITFKYNLYAVRVTFPNKLGNNQITSGNYPFRYQGNHIERGKFSEAWKEMLPALRAARFELQEMRNKEMLGERVMDALKGEGIVVMSVHPARWSDEQNRVYLEATAPFSDGYKFGLELNGDITQKNFVEAFMEYTKRFNPETKARAWCNKANYQRSFLDGVRGATAIKERLERAADKMKPLTKQAKKTNVER